MNFILFQLKFIKFKSKIKFIKFELHNYGSGYFALRLVITRFVPESSVRFVSS